MTAPGAATASVMKKINCLIWAETWEPISSVITFGPPPLWQGVVQHIRPAGGAFGLAVVQEAPQPLPRWHLHTN